MKIPVIYSFAVLLVCSLLRVDVVCAVEPTDFLQPILSGKAIEWEISDDVKMAFLQPYVAIVASSPTGDLQIGFSHRGYTSQTNSRSASLIAAIDVDSVLLTEPEIKRLKSDGYNFIDSQAKIGALQLDISLVDNPEEEARLRTEGKFPRVIIPGSLNLVNLKWEDVKGATLYAWLTSSKGLRFVMRGSVILTSNFINEFVVDKQKLNSWWSENVGGAGVRFEWRGGAGVLAYELIHAGVFVNAPDVNSLGLNGLSLTILGRLSDQISRISNVDKSGLHSIFLSDLVGIKLPTLERVELKLEAPVDTKLEVGDILVNSPEYVIDQSGGISGLKALLRDQ